MQQAASQNHPWQLLAAATILLSFFPYVGLPLGSAVNIPAAAICGLIVWATGPRSSRINSGVLLVTLLPISANAVSTVALNSPFPASGIVGWVGNAGLMAGGALAVSALGNHLTTLIAACIIGTSGFAWVQLAAIYSGSIPFLEYYSLAGYASVATASESIIEYVKRPFAQFPEPSFLACTLTLALFAMLISARNRPNSPLTKIEWAALVSGGVTIALTQSGSAVVSLVALSLFALLTAERASGKITLGILTLAGIYGAWWVLVRRTSSSDFSWSDRYLSIEASFEYWATDLGRLLIGTGRGGLTSAFAAGRVPLAGYPFYSLPPDIFSASGRVLIEFGLIAGGAVVVAASTAIWRACRKHGRTAGLLTIAAWLVASALTTSYESAAWLWLLPAICAGLALEQAPKKGISSNRSQVSVGLRV